MKKRLLLVFLSFASSVIAEDKLDANQQKNEQPTTSIQSCTPRKTCGRMYSCEEAYYRFKKCGNKSLDRDRDGIPCESICSEYKVNAIKLRQNGNVDTGFYEKKSSAGQDPRP
jgi:hypothetical protein